MAIGGPHGAGKTTLARLLEAQIGDATIVPDVARSCPIPFESATMVGAQRWVLENQLRVEKLFTDDEGTCIFDGCSLGHLAYFEYCGGADDDLASAVLESMKRMSRIVWLPPQERFLTDDGVRPLDPGFQRDIFERQKQLIEQSGLPVEILEPDWPELMQFGGHTG